MDGPSDTADRRLSILRQAEDRGNVSEVCEDHGISRTLFYRWQRRYEASGIEGLEDQAPIAKSHPSATPEKIKKRVIACAVREPVFGCRDIADKLSGAGAKISPVTVQKILNHARLGTRRERWLALERFLFIEKARLSAAQLAFVERMNPNVRDRRSRGVMPASVLCVGIFGQYFPQGSCETKVVAVIDTFSGFTFARTFGWRIDAIQAQNVLIDALRYFTWEMQLTVRCVLFEDRPALRSIAGLTCGQVRAKFKFLPTHSIGFVDRLRRSLSADIRDGKFHHRLPIPPLTEAFEEWLMVYNYDIANDGFPNFGRTPSDTFRDALV